MNAEFDQAVEQRRRRRRRGWIEIAIGFALIAASIFVTWYTFTDAIERGGGKFIVWSGAAVTGFLSLIRGMLRLLRVEEDALTRKRPAKPVQALSVGIGFKTFVAWRYLMAREHRMSRPVLVTLLTGVFLIVMGMVLERSVVHGAGRIDLELAKNLKQGIVGMQIGGVVLVFGALIVGALRFVFSFFTTVPLVGVWIGTGALVCVLAVMSGFETDLREKILGSNAHIQITRDDGKDFTNWRDIKGKIDRVPGVVASSPYAMSEVVIAANNNGMPVIIKGIDPDSVGKVTDLIDALKDKEAIKRLEPLVDDPRDLSVPDTTKPGAGVVDPPPSDMPGVGEPIDFSQPAAGSNDPSTDDPNQPPSIDEPGPTGPPPPPLDDTPRPTDDMDTDTMKVTPYGGDANVVQKPTLDPPPPDLVTLDEEPQDFSGDEDTIHVIDVPMEPSLSRRTQSLPGILVGAELVKQTHLYTGEEVRIVSPLSDPANPDATGTPIPFNRDYRVAGVFYTGMYEYDLKYVYVTIDSLTDFLDRGDVVDGIEVRIGSPDDTDEYVGRLRTLLGPQYRVQDWKELNRSLFSALKLEKIAMFLVLGIVILVASFSIVGNLIMVVVEKGREIALLKTLGASDTNVMLVFAIQGLLIGMVGTALGLGTGLLACWFGKEYGIPLNPDVYYIDRMPVHVDPTSVLMTGAAGILISMLATFYPALVAARVRPAAGMRH
jgi:lipoprotein-releasing system permease protein